MKRLFAVPLALAVGFVGIATSPSAAGVAAGSPEGPYEGNWTVAYGCQDPGFVQGSLCRSPYDEFSLMSLTQVGSRLCGTHLATARLGNRVDDGDTGSSPSIKGTIAHGSASVKFFSARSPDIGRATLRRVGETLVWDVVQAISSENYFPDHAVLVRDRRLPTYRRVSCGK